MSQKKAVKKKVVSVPKDRQELEEFVARIRRLEEMINVIDVETTEELSELSIQVNEVKERAQKLAKPFEEEINGLAKGVYRFAESHRVELTDENRQKTVEFTCGDKIRWYLTPWSVVVLNETDAIIELEGHGLDEFIRVKREINKEAILQEPKKIKKLKNLILRQNEIFAIMPVKMDFELQKGERKFKKVKI